MSIDVIVVDGTAGGINTNVVRVVTQTTKQNGSTVNTATNKGYILSGSTLQTVSLPNSPKVGDIIYLQGDGIGLFRIDQVAGEQVILGDTATTLGAGGFSLSTNSGDSLYLICVDNAGVWRNNGGYGGVFLIDGVTPVNTINDIPAVSATRSYGALYKTVGDSAEALTVNVPKLMAVGTWNSGLLSNFTRAGSRLTYTGADTKPFSVTYELGTRYTANVEVSMLVYKNGIAVPGGDTPVRNYFILTGITVQSPSVTATVMLSTNDFVEPWAACFDGSISFSYRVLRVIVSQLD